MHYRQFIFVFLGISSIILLIFVLNYFYPVRASLYPYIPDSLKIFYLQTFPRTNPVDFPQPDGPSASPNVKTTEVPTPTPSSKPNTNGMRPYTYTSLDGQFFFDVYYAGYNGDPEKCLYGVRDAGNNKYDVAKLLGLTEITCGEGAGSHWSSFKSWADNNTFLLEEKLGDIKIVNPVKITVETYNYDPAKFNFRGANRSLEYWLFWKTEGHFTLLNRSNGVVIADLDAYNSRPVLYDSVNDGFVFINRKYEGENVSIGFDFLSMQSLVLIKNILVTEETPAPGRGCYPESLLSKPGEIIITQGCLTVAKQYLGSDGNIHIKL